MKKLLSYTFIITLIVCFFSGCSNKNVMDTSNQTNEDKKVIETKKHKKIEMNTEELKPKQNESLMKNKLDVKRGKITIVIDPGHASRSNLEKEPMAPGSKTLKIKDGGGATGISTKIPEYETCMSVAKYVQQSLKNKGFNAIMTKTHNNVSLGNIERAEFGNNVNAALVIRIHADGADDKNVKGASMLVPKPINDNTKSIFEKSKEYGLVILDTYCDKIKIKNRGVFDRDDMTGFNWSRVPVVLIEMGFISNEDEDKYISNKENHIKIGEAISDGIEKCFQNN